MDLHTRIHEHFKQNVLLISQLAPLLAEPIEQASALIAETLLTEHKILCCGNSLCASNAQYLTSRLLGHLRFERPALAAINLSQDAQLMTSMSAGHQFDQLYSRQIMALGAAQDVLVCMCLDGNSINVINAIHTAHERNLRVIMMTGGDGGEMIEVSTADDIHISIPSDDPARVQEVFILVMHCLCDAIDSILLGVE
jgi:D-sedoheptulose 7-phosphate isomerase